jgi:hypothetical protein
LHRQKNHIIVPISVEIGDRAKYRNNMLFSAQILNPIAIGGQDDRHKDETCEAKH